jgi:hypothetical protein
VNLKYHWHPSKAKIRKCLDFYNTCRDTYSQFPDGTDGHIFGISFMEIVSTSAHRICFCVLHLSLITWHSMCAIQQRAFFKSYNYTRWCLITMRLTLNVSIILVHSVVCNNMEISTAALGSTSWRQVFYCSTATEGELLLCRLILFLLTYYFLLIVCLLLFSVI